MKKKLFSIFAVLFLVFAFNANAALTDNGNGTITDTDLDIMWRYDANESGLLTWQGAIDWAEGLNYAGYDDWRLPMSDVCSGYNCTASEMGHLYNTEGIKPSAPGNFIDLQSYMYWSGTTNAANSANAWRLNFRDGYQSSGNKTFTAYALAVRDIPDTPVAPEPVSSILFLTGGIVLAAKKIKKK